MNTNWTEALVKAGAPILRDLVKNQIGGIGGEIAGRVIDTLADRLSISTAGRTQEQIGEQIAHKIETDPAAAPIVQQVEHDLARVIEAATPAMLGYQEVLRVDAQSEGILSRLWRPLFALMFTVTYAMTIVTVLWLMWTRQTSTIGNFNEIAGFLTFAFLAGCAVLGVQVWQQGKPNK